MFENLNRRKIACLQSILKFKGFQEVKENMPYAKHKYCYPVHVLEGQIHAVPLHSAVSAHDSSPVQGALILICGIKWSH